VLGASATFERDPGHQAEKDPESAGSIVPKAAGDGMTAVGQSQIPKRMLHVV
jgi:hypothetical protein